MDDAAQRARRRRIARSPRVIRAKLFRLFVWFTMLLTVAGVVVACSWSKIRVLPIFRIKAFQMVGCPVPGQSEMRKLLAPFVGRSMWDMPGIATGLDAKLKIVPELRGVRFVRHWPNEVEVRVKGREPVAVAKTGDTWLSVDEDGVGMRYYRTQPSCLVAVVGLSTMMADGKPAVSRDQLALTIAVRQAAKQVLGAEPRSIRLGDGGAALALLTNGDTVRLGQIDQLTAKFQVYRAIRANHNQPVAYVDVSDPSAPAILAAPKAPPAPRAAAPSTTDPAKPATAGAEPAKAPSTHTEAKPTKPTERSRRVPAKPTTATPSKPSTPAKASTSSKTSAAKPTTAKKSATKATKPATPAKKPAKPTSARKDTKTH